MLEHILQPTSRGIWKSMTSTIILMLAWLSFFFTRKLTRHIKMTLTPDWYEWVHCDEANFIVVGSDHMSGYGVVATTRDEFTAHRIKKFVNDNGGCVEVRPYSSEEMEQNHDNIAKIMGWNG